MLYRNAFLATHALQDEESLMAQTSKLLVEVAAHCSSTVGFLSSVCSALWEATAAVALLHHSSFLATVNC